WTIVSNPGPPLSELRAVTALSASDAWAVGDFPGNVTVNTLVEHWNGSVWAIVSSPNDGNFSKLFGVDAVCANDVWSVGAGASGTLTEHWNGSAWTIVPSPNPDPWLPTLYAVAAVSSNDVWTAGDYTDDMNNQSTVIEHYRGCNPSPSPTPTSVGATATRT